MKRISLYFLFFLLPSLFSACNQREVKEQTSGEEPWYKNSFIYNLEVGTFKDGDGDGLGDFKGLIQKMDYLDSLGVSVIWLAPFMPSPGKDDGYDITDYYSVNPKLGTMADFKDFIAEAKKRHIKVIMDIVLNHTSIEHPWFQASRADSNSKYRLWYVWLDKKPSDADQGMVFPGVQKETWSYDDKARKYYFHRFYRFQADLNYGNPDVQRESFNVLKYWLKLGVDGYRLDAVPFIIDLPETGSNKPERMLNLVAKFRSEMKTAKNDALMLGEANLSPKENKDYFGEQNEGMQMMFNFYANQYLFYSLASGDIKSFVTALEDTRKKPVQAQWAYFLRNHDEIDLARLTTSQRNLIYGKFGPDTNMQLYDRGIRRRLAPMLNNPQQLRMAYSLLFSLPGAPVIRYGEEIGMGDDLSLQERLSIRTPMQWSAAANGGFSTSKKTFRPVISLGDYSYRKVNVELEEKDPKSLLNFIKKLVKMRKAHPEIGFGNFKILDAGSPHILAVRYDYNGKSLLAVHNFSAKKERVSIDKGLEDKSALTDPNNGSKATSIAGGKVTWEMPGYGYQWLGLAS